MRNMLSPTDEVAAAMNAVAAIMRRMPSELRARFRAEAEQRRLRRARFLAEVEERKLDEVLDRLADAGGVGDQDEGDPVGDRRPLVPSDVLFGLLIGVLGVGLLIAMLALGAPFRLDIAVNTQNQMTGPIAARADSVRPTVEARASDNGEVTEGGNSTVPSIPEPSAPRAAPRPDALPTVAVPRWGVWLAANLSESKAWALYHERLRRFASLIGNREPVVLFRQLPGMGKRYIIAIVDDDRAPLDEFCKKLAAAGSTCDVMRNEFGP